MRRFLLFILAIGFCLNLCACVTDAPSKETADAPSTETTDAPSKNEAKDETFGLNETAVFSDLKFTATEIVEKNGDDFFTPEQGNIFVGIKFTVENISNEDQSVSTLLLFDGYSDDIKAEYSFTAACVFDEGTLDGTIAPGKKLVGWYALEVPMNWSNIELHVQSNWLSNNSAKFVFTK